MLVAKASMTRNNQKLKISVNNESIPNEQKLTLLGVEVDNQLKFNDQVTKICKKVSKHLSVMSRMKTLLPTKHEKNSVSSLSYFTALFVLLRSMETLWKKKSR